MPRDDSQQKKSPFKNPLIYSGAVVLLAALYAGIVLFSRGQEDREIERRNAEKRRGVDALAVESMGGDRFEIQSFYAAPGHIRRGESAQLCYGVANAKKVTLDPPAGAVWPSYSRCLSVSPEKTTAYTLSIEDAQGNKKSESLTLAVK